MYVMLSSLTYHRVQEVKKVILVGLETLDLRYIRSHLYRSIFDVCISLILCRV